MLTRVKDLIADLQKLDQEAIVLYAFNEYGNHGIHSQITTDALICCDLNGELKLDEDNDLILRYTDDDDDDYVEEFPKLNDPNLQWFPAIKMFSE